MKSKLLIIDDNEMMRSFLKHILANNFDAEVVSSGEEALEVLHDKARTPELILADFDLDGMNGLELLIYLKSSAVYKQVPVVILSGKGNSNNRINCLKAGASDFITKPFNPVELQVKIQGILETNRTKQPA
ncbi:MULTISPECIES: PleD family two-component system response regulator [unclassified Imperialibacter]|uniref:response regulator n=1 Tax=unclassified Imperialibacter TaxID=2629706 RepID=UPI0012562A2A|nr:MULTISPECIES: response regulator transcription factor [unclassified Imperialibacter]CAD5255966.1 Two-component system response regulator [Imperialibacter sp. 89]CAD5262053.1 Two-component system response regulator [Imperialibacter sp. 75]VVT33039.1 Two-component system response regulator [Imperialibacter sp. EC-SDR9]